MAPPVKLTVKPGCSDSQTAQLVLAYAGVSAAFEVVSGDALSLALPGGAVSGVNTVCTELAAAAEPATAAALLGSDDVKKALIAEAMSWTHTALSPLKDEALAKLSARLADRVYIEGGAAPSLADLVLYGKVHAAVAGFPKAQTLHFAPLLRWAEHLGATADAGSVFAPIVVPDKPAFVAPPPPPPPAEKGKGKGEEKKADGKKGGDEKKGADEKKAGGEKGEKGDGKKAQPEAKAPEGGKKEKKEKKEKAPKPAKEAPGVRIDQLDIRVGTITACDVHPNADALYLEHIDLGEDKPRQVISGLVKFVPLDKMVGRRVVVVTNLKPAKMRDVMSYGMVLCASNEEHTAVDPVAPPEGVPNGEKITIEGYSNDPDDVINPKKKILEKLFPDMVCNADGVPCFKDVPFMTTKGPVTSPMPKALVR